MIKLQIQDFSNGKEVNFEADNYTAEEVGQLITKLDMYMHRGSLNPNGRQRASAVAPSSVNRAIEPTHTDKATNHSKPFHQDQSMSKSNDEKKTIPAPTKSTEPKRTRPRSTALLNNERTLNASIGEHVSVMDQVKSIALVQKENPEPDRMKWKTKFQCPECGLKEDKQVYKGFRYTACDNCETKVKIMPADMKNGWDHEDEEGYLYHAKSRYVLGGKEQ
ncbi:MULTISPECIES: hypothetical protein [Bacillus]|uniref:hypothetical protein n=1 Tax=Bacillus TaxID=1386 RepID=UPI000701B20D|nr:MULTISPECIES: hypothetical protein [Bacillus]KQU15364.1 hypothetical protein ASG46_00350 [Bacillus sp. Leaf49]MCS3483196.1 hypothetical protein [Bacillus sp. JUb11]MCY7621071.1 hypothetical protein [Bacillus altitudinis]MDI6562597.1 hypothetical protein [Bacillus altitudinis]MDI6646385.1 hypothetical protein [Bacillus altitudinis]